MMLVWLYGNTMGAYRETGTVYHSGALAFIQVFNGVDVAQALISCIVCCCSFRLFVLSFGNCIV